MPPFLVLGKIFEENKMKKIIIIIVGLALIAGAAVGGYFGGKSDLDNKVAEIIEQFQNGKNGADGSDGQDGAAGKSAYDLAVENGFVGTVAEWLDSLQGADGNSGNNGADGARGNSFWVYNTPSNVPITDFRDPFPFAQVGDYIVNASLNQRTIFGLNVLIGGVVQITGYTSGIIDGNIRGPQGPQGVSGNPIADPV